MIKAITQAWYCCICKKVFNTVDHVIRLKKREGLHVNELSVFVYIVCNGQSTGCRCRKYSVCGNYTHMPLEQLVNLKLVLLCNKVVVQEHNLTIAS